MQETFIWQVTRMDSLGNLDCEPKGKTRIACKANSLKTLISTDRGGEVRLRNGGQWVPYRSMDFNLMQGRARNNWTTRT